MRKHGIGSLRLTGHNDIKKGQRKTDKNLCKELVKLDNRTGFRKKTKITTRTYERKL